jgi:hypothetical protein
VARNQAAVVGITTAGEMKTSGPGVWFRQSHDDDNPLSQFFRGIPAPAPRGHALMHAQGSGFLVSPTG